MPDGVVDQVGGEVVAVLVGARRLDDVVVVHEGRDELVDLAREEPVEALEPAPERPPVAAGAEVRLVLGGQVPLAHRVRGVAVGREHGWQQGARWRDAGVVAGEAVARSMMRPIPTA